MNSQIIINCETLEVFSLILWVNIPASSLIILHIFECSLQRNNEYVSEKILPYYN